MCLTAGVIRELHWHTAAEWAIMLYGGARITAIDDEGRSFVRDKYEDDLWYFPTGIPHSIQRLGLTAPSSCWCSLMARFPNMQLCCCQT